MNYYRERLEKEIAALGVFPRVISGSDDLTFTGVLVDFFEPRDEIQLEEARNGRVTLFVRQNWNIDEESETVERNINDYIRDILPVIDRDKALKDYTREDIDSIILKIRKKARSDSRTIGEDRIGHFEDLLLVVYEVGANNRLFEDTLSVDKIRAEMSDLSEKEEASAKILLRPKSLSLEHEKTLLKAFRDADICTMPGEMLAAYLQMFTGLRNEEATAVLFGDIYKLHDSGRSAMKIYKSSPGRGGKLRIEMKTRNAYRNLPVFGFLAMRLEKRFEYIKTLYPSEDVSKFTITCKGIAYDKTIGSADLTEAGGKLLMDTAPKDKKTQRALSEMLSNLKQEGLSIEEKSATAYLFRRNFATHLHNLGVPQSTAEFLIGHEILESGVERNHFISDEEMEVIHDYFRFHPFNDAFPGEGYDVQERPDRGCRVSLEVSEKTMYRIRVNEPRENVEFQIADEDRAKVRISFAPLKDSFGAGIDLVGVVNQAYAPESD